MKEGYHRIESEKAWEALWLKHQTGKKERGNSVPNSFTFCEVDFKKYMLLAVFQGFGVNRSGYEVHSITEEKDRLVIRVLPNNFQTLFELSKTTAWGVFVLPRSTKPVVIELDTKSLTADPPKWTRQAELKPCDSTSEK